VRAYRSRQRCGNGRPRGRLQRRLSKANYRAPCNVLNGKGLGDLALLHTHMADAVSVMVKMPCVGSEHTRVYISIDYNLIIVAHA
jgi:hypothetical protein